MYSSNKIFLQKIWHFQHLYKKKICRKRIRQIRNCYRELNQFCLENKLRCGVLRNHNSISIRIQGTSLLLSDEIPGMQWLFQNANLMEFDCSQGMIRVELWFRCWNLDPLQESFPA